MILNLPRLSMVDSVQTMSASTFDNDQSINDLVTPLVSSKALLILDVPVTEALFESIYIGAFVFSQSPRFFNFIKNHVLQFLNVAQK